MTTKTDTYPPERGPLVRRGWQRVTEAGVVQIARERPLATAYAVSLIVLMSPLSRSGHIAESSAISWLMVAILAVSCRRAGATRPRQLPGSVALALAALLFVVAVYSLVGLVRGNGVRLVAWEANPFLEFAAFLFLARFIVRTRADVKLVLVLVLSGAVAKSVGDLSVFGWDVSHSHYSSLTAGLANRIEDVAPFLLAPVALFLAVGWRLPRGRRVTLFGVFLVLTTVMIASLTRSFWIGILAGVLAGAAVDRGANARRVLIAGAAIGCVIAIGYVAAPQSFAGAPGRLVKERFYDYTRTQLHSHDLTLATRRQDELRQAWQSARYDWFLGRGLGGTLPRTFAELTPTEGPRVAFLHNYFAQILVKMGILGLAAFIAVIATTLVALLRTIRAQRDFDRAVATAVLASCVMEGVQLLLYPKTNIFHVGAFMAALVGVVSFSGEKMEEGTIARFVQLELPLTRAAPPREAAAALATRIARICVTVGLVYAGSPLSFYLQFRGTSFYNAYPARSHLALDAAITMVPVLIALVALARAKLLTPQAFRPLVPTSLIRPLLATASVVVVATALGLAFGNRPSLIAGDIEPYLEFGAYLAAGLLAFSRTEQVRSAAAWIFGSLCLTAVIRLAFAAEFKHGFGVTGVLISGHFVPRLFLLQPYAWLLAVAVAVAALASTPRLRRLAAATATLFVLTSLISFERALWVLAFVACIPVLWAAVRKHPTRAILTGSLGIALLLGGMTAILVATGARANPISLVVERLAYSKNQLSSSSDTIESKRNNEMRRLLHSYGRDPKGWLFGQGLGAEYVGPTGLLEGTYAKSFRKKHYVFDSYLALLLRMGVIGLFANVWLIGAMIWAFMKLNRYAHAPVIRAAAAGSAAATVGLAAMAVFQPYLLAHPLAAFEGVVLATLLNLRRFDEVV